MSSKDGGGNDMEKPLKGTVLCCTSIAPEKRTYMAEAAIQMGAAHKLDLTSDVTHLIVGDSNTPKYKYVARERADIKVLQLEWVEAVRQAWMQGGDVDLEALEEEYRLPTFAGLKVCLTGFEDLTFRAQLQECISANGGEYRGDLTKDVTHLVACTPEGKKYQYATQWEIKVVGLKWLRDSMDRRMILEEALYHPSLAEDKLGVGAWNRLDRVNDLLGKRARAEEAVAGIPRKLRRTASAKLGSQSETLWNEIVNVPPREESAENDLLRPSESLPVLKAVVLEPKLFVTDSTGTEEDPRKVAVRGLTAAHDQQSRTGIFSSFGFFLQAFNSKQTSILREHILSNDGELLESLTDLPHAATSNLSRLFLIVPYSLPVTDIPSFEHIDTSPEVVTDLWAERCLQCKQFFEPDEHVLSRPIPVFPIAGFEKLVVNSTGLTNIDLLHVSKVVQLLGAKYDQVLKTGISVLVCNPSKAGEEKLRHACEWGIPRVSVDWLWACLRSSQMQSFRSFLLKQGQSSQGMTPDQNGVVSARPLQAMRIGGGEQSAANGQHVNPGHPIQTLVHRASSGNDSDNHQISKASRMKPSPGDGFLKSPQSRADVSQVRGRTRLSPTDLALVATKREPQKNCGCGTVEAEKATSPRKARLFRRFDGQSSLPDRDKDNDSSSAPEAASTGKTTHMHARAESIDGAIKELLGKGRAKNTTSAIPKEGNKKKPLLGRAMSNISNSSREGSKIRDSRASSIDSVNTDGLGSVFLDERSQSRRPSNSGAGGRSCFSTGRASAQQSGINGSSLELGDRALYREEYQEEAEPPLMTQLGYENPDDAVALRELLAERRRNRSRKGQEVVKPAGSKEGKRIKDDATVVPPGWGTGRRTRQQAKGSL